MTEPVQIKEWIEAGMPDASVAVEGDGAHFEAVVISAEFTGKNLIARHRIVYDALGDKMKQEIHALSLKTLTPEESQ